MGLSNYLPSSRLIQPGVCTSSTRPASPFEGQAIYETDTDMMAIWNGSAWRYIAATTPTNGAVLQVVSTSMTDTQTITTQDSWVTVTNLQATITPKATSSKIFVSASISYGGTSNTYGAARLVRGSTAISIGDAASTRTRVSTSLNTDNDSSSGAAKLSSASLEFLDSPSTTSSTTYKIEVWNDSAVAGSTLAINRTGTDSTNSFYFRGASTITLMELAG